MSHSNWYRTLTVIISRYRTLVRVGHLDYVIVLHTYNGACYVAHVTLVTGTQLPYSIS